MRSLFTIVPAVLLALALALAGCGQAASTATNQSTPSVASDPSATETDAASPEPTAETSQQPSAEETGLEAGMTITGQLASDDIEGGCAFVAADDGTRYEVLWPDGWNLDRATLELTNPDGQVVATGGDRITVRGQLAPDVGSICQIGPIIEAVDVELAE